jgi:hypothetical protein
MPDGAGGTIIAWLDNESPSNIYIQRLDPDGNIMWYPGGVQITGASFYEGTSTYPTRIEMATDCRNGVIIAWPDSRNADIDIFAQWIDSDGHLRWDEGGEDVCTETGNQRWPDIVSNDDRGALVVWLDDRNGNEDIYTQLLDRYGRKDLEPEGREVRTLAGSDAGIPSLVNEGDGYARVVYHDNRDGASDINIYSNTIYLPSGSVTPVDGSLLCDSSGNQTDPKTVPDGLGGSIIAWRDGGYVFGQRMNSGRKWSIGRSGISVCPVESVGSDPRRQWQMIPTGDGGAIFACTEPFWDPWKTILVRKIYPDGNTAWASPTLMTTYLSDYPSIAPDGVGGAIITWRNCHWTDGDIEAQRVDSLGVEQWGEYGIEICAASYTDLDPQISPDGSGGAVISWYSEPDVPSSKPYTAHAQKVDGSGATQWTTCGLDLNTPDGDQNECAIANRNSGSFIVWEDDRNGGDSDIYIQSLDETGNPSTGSGSVPYRWKPGGIPVCLSPGTQRSPRIISSTAGVIISWADYETDSTRVQRYSGGGYRVWDDEGIAVFERRTDMRLLGDGHHGAIVVSHHASIMAQKIDDDGVKQWGPDGIAVTPAINLHGSSTAAVEDGSGGFFLAWTDNISGIDSDVYAQHVDMNGALLWGPGGVEVCMMPHSQGNMEIVPDGSGGVIITWMDDRDEQYTWEIYAQRLDASGTPMWTIDGIPLNEGFGYSRNQAVVADGFGGAFVLIGGNTGSNFWPLKVQHVTGSGFLTLGPSGTDLSPTSTDTWGSYRGDIMISDGSGGVFVAWSDDRNGNYDVFCQRILFNGSLYWPSGGLEVCTESNMQVMPVVTMDRDGRVIVAWDDYRDADWRIYAQEIDVDYTDADIDENQTPSADALYQNMPNPFNPATTIRFDLSRIGNVKLSIYNVKGELVTTLIDGRMEAGRKEITWQATDAQGDPLSSGVYFYRLATEDIVQTRKMVLLR